MTPVGLSSEDVLRHCRVFCELQQGLITRWRKENPEAKDMEMLLDFKKEATFEHAGVEWTSKKHGVGVRFDSKTGTLIDVPFGIDQPDKIEPDRAYDYLVSIGAFDSLHTGKPRRSAIYQTFDDFEREGMLIVSADANGRMLYELAVVRM